MSNYLGFVLTFDKYKKIYERAVASVEKEIKEYFEDIGSDHIHYVKGRVKSSQNIGDKVKRKKYEDVYKQMDDIAGVRVVCHNESDVEEVATFIKKRYQGAIKEDENIDRDDGYKAHHFVVYVQVLLAGIPERTKVEIQLRTIAQDFYDTLSRRDMYKIPALSEAWLEKMRVLSSKVREVDKLAEELKKEWIDLNISTKVKNKLTAQTIKFLVKNMLNQDISIEESMDCLGSLNRRLISTITEVENILNEKNIVERIKATYQELLNRDPDPVGLIIYGSFFHKAKTLSDQDGENAIEIIRQSIQESPEYKQKVRFIKIEK